MDEQLLITPEYDELCTLLSGAGNGTAGIHDLEIKHLCWLGAHIPPNGDIVEIGSHRGKSICALVSGAVFAKVPFRAFAIDIWDLGKITFDHYKSLETWEIFNKQLERMGYKDLVRPVKSFSVDAAKRRKKPIHLLHIDGSHKYPDVWNDYTYWSPFVPSGGRIVFHDYNGSARVSKGVRRVVDEVVIPSGLWTDFHQYDRFWSAQRI